jgi:hypothetical protein
MTPTTERSNRDSWVARCSAGALPILICLLLMRLAVGSSPQTFVILCAACAAILWFGWSSVRRNLLTKWTGVILALYFGLLLGLSAFAIAANVLLALLPVFLLALPLLVYDLLFRAPSHGESDQPPVEPPRPSE